MVPPLLTVMVFAAVTQADGSSSSDTLSLPPEGPYADSYLDSTAEELIRAARRRRETVDRSLVSYTAVVRERLAAGIRTFRRDRTVFRKESATRVHWSEDGPILARVLAARMEHPAGVQADAGASGLGVDQLYDPELDQIFFGLVDQDEEDIFIEHPLRPGSEAHYRFATGDTLTLSMPDGRRLRGIEVRVVPRIPSIKLITGSIWVEPETGGLMRAAYRLSREIDVERDWDLFVEASDEDADMDEARKHMSRVPGMFRPFQFEVRMVVVDYSLWRFRYWLPRLLRVEGEARAGIIRAPATYEVTYEIEEALGEEDLLTQEAPSAWDVLDAWEAEGDFRLRRTRSQGRRVRVLTPWHEEELLDSPDLPPPVWESMGASLTEAELDHLFDGLSDLPGASLADPAWHVRWGYQDKDLLRYNRVEGLSIGVRVRKDLRLVDGEATLRLGIADPTPSAMLRFGHDRPDRRVGLSLFSELRSVDLAQRSLQLGNSANAMVLGRDYGEYHRATGASLLLTPPTTDRPWYRLGLFAQRETGVSVHTDVAIPGLWRSRVFRPNLAAEALDLYGAELWLTPWWGADRTRVQGGAELFVEAGAGDAEYARAQLELSGTAPLGDRIRLGVQVAGGTSWGSLPAQRHWFLGGPSTLRGYPGSVLFGPDQARARVELTRGIQAYGVAVFGDWGWAGEFGDLTLDRGLPSVGLGVSGMDGLVRLDLARGLRHPTGWRLELYLDALL